VKAIGFVAAIDDQRTPEAVADDLPAKDVGDPVKIDRGLVAAGIRLVREFTRARVRGPDDRT
jgi:hypothetical protein